MLGAGRTFSGSSWDVHHLQRVAPLQISSRQWGHFTLGAFGCTHERLAQLLSQELQELQSRSWRFRLRLSEVLGA